jgi:hypothetical protein
MRLLYIILCSAILKFLFLLLHFKIQMWHTRNAIPVSRVGYEKSYHDQSTEILLDRK